MRFALPSTIMIKTDSNKQIKTDSNKQILCLPWRFGFCFARHGADTMNCSLGGFGDEADDLPLHRAGGGQALCFRSGG
jgi:hypothetical protein